MGVVYGMRWDRVMRVQWMNVVPYLYIPGRGFVCTTLVNATTRLACDKCRLLGVHPCPEITKNNGDEGVMPWYTSSADGLATA